jgi:hypothetical protein
MHKLEMKTKHQNKLKLMCGLREALSSLFTEFKGNESGIVVLKPVSSSSLASQTDPANPLNN